MILISSSGFEVLVRKDENKIYPLRLFQSESNNHKTGTATLYQNSKTTRVDVIHYMTTETPKFGIQDVPFRVRG